LKEEKEALARKYEFAKFRLEDSEMRAKKAKDMYQDATTDLWHSEGNIEVVKRECIEVRRHRDVVSEQIQMMKQGVGFYCWPKPSLHPHLPEEEGDAFDLQPCLFYNTWYTSFDVLMASCKHFYHPLCISKVVDSQNCCVTYKVPFHPVWWKSFGFRPIQSDVQDDVGNTGLANSMEELSETFKDSFGIPIP
jgi:hypothetical protein